PPKWFATLLLQLLMKSNWSELGAEAISAAAWLLGRRPVEPSPSVLPPRFASLLPLLVLNWQDHPIEKQVSIGNFRFLFHKTTGGLEEGINSVSEAALAEDA